MRHIRVNGTFTPSGYSLSRMALVGDNGIDETRNTVYQVLRIVGNNTGMLMWDDGDCITFDDGTRIKL